MLSQEGISFSNVNCILLAVMHTWQVHVCLYTLIHTVHTLLGAQQTIEGRQKGQSGCWAVQIVTNQNILENKYEI